MALPLLLIILIVVAVLILFVSAFFAMRNNTTGIALGHGVTSGISGMIIGAIIGVIISFFAIFNIGLSGLLATLTLGLAGLVIGFILSFIFGFTYEALPPQIRNSIISVFGIILGIIALVGVVYLFLYLNNAGVLPEYMKFLSPAFDASSKAWNELAKFRYCFIADSRCPFFIQWENPNVQNVKEEFYVGVDFSDKRITKQNQLNLMASLTLKNPELAELSITPKCYFGKNKTRELSIGNMGAYSQGDKFVFGSTLSGQELHTSLRCTGDIFEASDKNIFSEIVVLTLERTVNVKTVWPIYIGEEPKTGLVKSEMKFNAPYSIALVGYDDMPFEEGKEYDFSIVMKKQQEDAKLKEINFISLKFSEDLMIYCDGFNGLDNELELKDYKADALRNVTQYDSEQDKFTWPCTLYVSNAPRQAVLSPVEVESSYVVYSDYQARAVKSP